MLIFQCCEKLIDFKNVVVGTSVARKITLCNPTNCDVAFRLVLSHEEDPNHEDDKLVISEYPLYRSTGSTEQNASHSKNLCF